MDSCIGQLRVKRSYSTNIEESVYPVNKKQKIISITSMENLSNEIFYEIFEYLDGCHIYEAFSNLNNHFNELLNSPSLLFKIRIYLLYDESYKDLYKQLILINKDKIISFDLCLSLENTDEFLSSYSIDSLFTRLESLSLSNIEPT
ncbi:unnamed protein product, partial [Adineta steineri]